MGDEATKGALLAQVNASIRELAGGSETASAEWEFFCECGAAECHEQITLTLEAYSAIHDGGFAILAPGHRLGQRARAQRLIDETRALRAQAEHQIKRAKRNLAGQRTTPEVVYFKHKTAVFALDATYAKALASTNQKCGLAVEIFARLATDSAEPVDLDLPGYASDARAALEAMASASGDAPQVAVLRAALG
jgi:hypothetical protein